jgi:hypothetical protein
MCLFYIDMEGDLGNQNISEYIDMPLNQLIETYRGLSLLISPNTSVANRMNLIQELNNIQEG